MTRISVTIMVDGQTLIIQFFLMLLPLALVEFAQALVPQDLQFLVCLLQLDLHVSLTKNVGLADGKLLLSLMPLGITTDSI